MYPKISQNLCNISLINVRVKVCTGWIIQLGLSLVGGKPHYGLITNAET